jgi:aerobic carbon-monoxide dehydrogenase small subunit
MRHSIAVTVNGVRREDAVEPRLLLVHYLRELAGLTGTHIACDTSQCGACTVLLDGRAVKSCSVLAVQADGRSVTTVEGLARGAELHPLQEAFWAEHGLQCGFCTPGFLMAAADLLAHTPTPTDDEIRRGLEGNICRCTGYENILKAVRAAGARMAAAAAETTTPAAEPAGVGS